VALDVLGGAQRHALERQMPATAAQCRGFHRANDGIAMAELNCAVNWRD